MRKIIFIAAISLSASTAPLPPPTLPEFNVRSTLHAKPVSYLSLGKLVIRFGVTSLGDIIKTIGIGEVGVQGDASESMRWICYTLPGQRLWLISGEMGGSDLLVTEIRAILDPGVDASISAPALPRSFMPVSLDNGLWLNSNAHEVTRILGKPSSAKAHYRAYMYSAPSNGNHGWTETNYLMLGMQNGQITSLEASCVLSN